MGNIVLLDELTINKIAAGEVIERPASVIKEMVENSIDAEATSINVDIKNGGISYIRITDNGRGIMPDDMEIAFERHATSKIRKAEDLENVRSMGFRGEALASIAAVAKVEMISRTTQMEVGNRIVVEAGKVLEKTETACTVGTTITVSNLFFNTPVRYKFLKKDFTESGYIEDAIARLALINPNISFKLVNSGKVIIQTSGNGKIEDVVYNIYGKNVAENLLKVDYSYEDMRISGVIGKPEIARSNRSNQLFFVNGRYVKDKTLTSAIEKGYKGMLTIGKYAFAILNIEMNPSKVDVNVHPAKLEVRFEEESKVFKAVYHAANDTLLKNDLIKNSEKIEREDQLDIAKIDKKEVDDVTLFRQSYEKMNLNSVNGNAIEQIYQLKKEEKKPLEEEMKTVKVGEKQKNEIPQGNHSTMESLLELQKKMREDLEKRKQELEEEQELQENTDTKEKQVKMNLNQKIEKIEEQAENLITENNIEVQEEMKKTEETKVEAEELKEMIHKLDETEEGTISKDFNEMYLKIFGKLPQKEQIEEDEKEAENFKLLDGENLTVFDEKEEYKFSQNII